MVNQDSEDKCGPVSLLARLVFGAVLFVGLPISLFRTGRYYNNVQYQQGISEIRGSFDYEEKVRQLEDLHERRVRITDLMMVTGGLLGGGTIAYGLNVKRKKHWSEYEEDAGRTS